MVPLIIFMGGEMIIDLIYNKIKEYFLNSKLNDYYGLGLIKGVNFINYDNSTNYCIINLNVTTEIFYEYIYEDLINFNIIINFDNPEEIQVNISDEEINKFLGGEHE